MSFSAVNTTWVLFGSVLVFLMQAGFACFESGLTREKNSGNIIMKNLMDFCIGSLVFGLVGFGLMYGKGNAMIGCFDFMTQGDYSHSLPDGIPFSAFFIFQTVFCGTAATIVSGAMAERTKFIAYCLYSCIISMFVYPISGHWIWGGGWLASLGFHDFAGGTVVHLTGGCAALIGAKVVGARIGKYDKKGRSKVMQGHNITLSALGVFILWFGWFGFNGGSTFGIESQELIQKAANIFVNTNLSAAAAGCMAMIFTWIRYRKPDVTMTLNGVLGGLAAITAGCDSVAPFGAVMIGILSGFTVVTVIELLDQKCKIDDPVGAVGVHFACGTLGTIAVGLFSNSANTGLGLFYGGGLKLFGIQLLGVISVIAWVSVIMLVAFNILKRTVGLRVSAKEEIEGLNRSEHGIYHTDRDINMNQNLADFEEEESPIEPIDRAIPVEKVEDSGLQKEKGLTKIEIFAKEERFNRLKEAMNQIGVTGMTVTKVLGCGMQKGFTEYYRGVPTEINMLPKIRVDIVVAKVPVDLVVETAKKVLYTGHIGDGKIFIYDVKNAVKVRTGEEGYAAMQGADDV